MDRQKPESRQIAMINRQIDRQIIGQLYILNQSNHFCNTIKLGNGSYKLNLGAIRQMDGWTMTYRGMDGKIDRQIQKDMQIDMFQDGFGWTFRQIDMLHMHIDRYGQTDRNKCISRQIWMNKQIDMGG